MKQTQVLPQSVIKKAADAVKNVLAREMQELEEAANVQSALAAKHSDIAHLHEAYANRIKSRIIELKFRASELA